MEHGSELGQALQSVRVGFRLLQMRKCSFLCWQLSGMALVIVSGEPSLNQCSCRHKDGESLVNTAQIFIAVWKAGVA